MKKILMTLVMLIPMVAAAEREGMRGQSPQEYLEFKQGAESQQAAPSTATMDEVTKRRLSRALDAMVRNLIVGTKETRTVAEGVRDRIKAEGRPSREAEDAYHAIMAAGIEMAIDNTRPYVNDMKGYKAIWNADGLFVRREDAPKVEGDLELFIQEQVAAWALHVPAEKAQMSAGCDENMPEVKRALEDVKRRLPPEGEFALK